MPEYVRVRDKDTRGVYTVLAQEVEVNPDAYEVLKRPAVNSCGDPLPADPPESTSASTGQSAATPKEK